MPPTSAHTPVRKPAHLLSPRVLIVEDESRLRELLLDVIPGMGFQASSARSAEEAGKLMDADAAEIVMLDLQLPVMNGMEFFEQIHQRWPGTQVIVMTGFGDLDSARRAIRLDVVDFLTKPFHLRDVEESLDRARKRIAEDLRIDNSVDDDSPDSRPQTLADAESKMIVAALQRHNGNRTAAALELGISRRKLHYWLNEHDGE